ncbi:hypothetical protein [Massilia glaciei]|uniref:Uncharacterized protein n=1 Tax=Massilia glaciei TaxID=1524097 RepID=A0A2U2HH80_9BURK|nr:hypothetical protein [Massilia glaciei]PWF44998.1 hypothetical protein C7C56_018490 [Massilia glaciei]
MRKWLANLFAPDAQETLSTLGSLELNLLAQGPVEFVFALVEGDNPNHTGELLGAVATIAGHNGSMVQDLVCNLAVLTVGTLASREPLVLERASLVNKLLQAMAGNIKLVHGVEHAHFGSMDSRSRGTYGALLPSFSAGMAVLHALPPGRAQELGAKGASA